MAEQNGDDSLVLFSQSAKVIAGSSTDYSSAWESMPSECPPPFQGPPSVADLVDLKATETGKIESDKIRTVAIDE